MTQLNVSFGLYAFLPQGWIFMIAIIFIECIVLSLILSKKWLNEKIYNTIIFSNLISGIIGVLISFLLNGGWWLIVWFPWVSSNEVSSPIEMSFLEYYLFAFLSTLLIEGIFNSVILRRVYKLYSIIPGTLLVNVVSYLIGSVAMYSYSF